MRVGIDFYEFDPECTGGVHTFALGIAKGLLASLQEGDSLVIIISEKNETYFEEVFGDSSVKILKISVVGFNRYINRAIWMLSWISHIFKLRYWYDKYFRIDTMKAIDEHVDAVVVPISVLSFYALEAPSILCIHDIQQEYYPESFSFNQRILRWASYRLSCWRAEAIQVSSNYIKECLLEKFKFINPEAIFVAHEGVDIDKFSMDIQEESTQNLTTFLADGFVFYPAQLWLHKNHFLLIESLSIFRDKMGYEIPCVLTGYDYGHWGLVQDRIVAHELKCVFYLGRVSFEQVLWLYRNCKAVLALGVHESSSLPVREGAVFGKPLICSDIPPNIETQEYLYLRIVDNVNPKELADVLIELVDHGEVMNAESSKNISRVKIFRWDVIAEKYIYVLKEALNKR